MFNRNYNQNYFRRGGSTAQDRIPEGNYEIAARTRGWDENVQQRYNHFPQRYGGILAEDRNGDGLITEADYAIGAHQMGWGYIGEEMARAAFRYHDKNRNGYLDREDMFLSDPRNAYRSNFASPRYGGILAQDRNGDGLITEADFVIGAHEMGWGRVGEEVARAAFRHYDKNRNGFLDPEDAQLAYSYLSRLYN